MSSKKKKRIVRSIPKYKANVKSQKQKHEEFEGRMANLFTDEQYPIYDAASSQQIFKTGMGSVLLSRVINSQKIAFGVFLLDAYCLGVKNAFYKEDTRIKYSKFKQQMYENDPMEEIAPSYARKLIEECVRYAQEIGLPPHKDYQKAKRIFGNIDSGDCPAIFTFGKDGKPFFISGPKDTQQRCREIIEILERKCGSGNYDYIMVAD